MTHAMTARWSAGFGFGFGSPGARDPSHLSPLSRLQIPG
jgi:hypothetical protein